MTCFTKGQSGNPGGRPRGAYDVRELARQHTSEAIETLARICADEGAAPAARVAAANALLDRAWGKPVQTMHTTPSDPSELTDAKLTAIIRGTREDDAEKEPDQVH